QKVLERPTTQGPTGRGLLTGAEGIQSLLLVDSFGFVGKQDGIAVEGKAHLLRIGHRRGRGQQRGRGETMVERIAHIFRMGGQEQVATKGPDIAVGTAATTEGRPSDLEPM